MALTEENIRAVRGEFDAQTVYREVRQQGDFLNFTRRFMHNEDGRVARNAFWVLTKATDDELSQLQVILQELIDLSMKTDNSSVRRLSLNLVERLNMEEEDMRTDFLNFCLEHMVDIEELPGIQTLCMKLACKMCKFYPELMDEFKRIVDAMRIEYYKPAVRGLQKKILSGKMR